MVKSLSSSSGYLIRLHAQSREPQKAIHLDGATQHPVKADFLPRTWDAEFERETKTLDDNNQASPTTAKQV